MSRKRIWHGKPGFTLIELIVVIGILGILIAGVMIALNPIDKIQEGNDTKRKSDLQSIQKALELYYSDYGKYPASSGAPNFQIDPFGTPISWGSSWKPYIATLPQDPNGSKHYVYITSSDLQSYQLYASLDRGEKDPNVCHPNQPTDTACDGAGSANATCGNNGQICDYGVSSPNVSP